MLPSLMLSAEMCEWQSMMPGMMYPPPASITCAPGGARTLSPAAVILPSWITTDPWNEPRVTVSTLAFWITTAGPAAASAALAANPSNAALMAFSPLSAPRPART